MIVAHIIDMYFVVDDRLSDAGERWKIKQLPGRVYNDEIERWLIPIRPGLLDAIRNVFGYDMLAELLEIELHRKEKDFIDLLKPPPPGSVNIWEVSAEDALELATTHHLYDAHNGNEDDYNKFHYPTKFGE